MAARKPRECCGSLGNRHTANCPTRKFGGAVDEKKPVPVVPTSSGLAEFREALTSLTIEELVAGREALDAEIKSRLEKVENEMARLKTALGMG